MILSLSPPNCCPSLYRTYGVVVIDIRAPKAVQKKLLWGAIPNLWDDWEGT